MQVTVSKPVHRANRKSTAAREAVLTDRLPHRWKRVPYVGPVVGTRVYKSLDGRYTRVEGYDVRGDILRVALIDTRTREFQFLNVNWDGETRATIERLLREVAR